MLRNIENRQPSKAHRVPEIDILRGLAILLVIWYHSAAILSDAIFSLPVGVLRRVIYYGFYNTVRVGWVGVDLFFVLSGFLISGLMFREWLKFGRISYWSFIIRRGLKIYPGFYVLLIYTLLLALVLSEPIPATRVFAEIFYLQNYLTPLRWGHCWTLAIEEHFYLGLPLCLIVMERMSRCAKDPFRHVPLLFLAVTGLTLGLRVLVAAGCLSTTSFRPTHFRLDGLMFGVFLSYLYHFKPAWLRAFFGWRPALQVFAAILTVVIVGVFPAAKYITNLWFLSFGLTFLFLACGTMLMHFIFWEGQFKDAFSRRLNVIGRLGYYSYSVYLWHIPVRDGTVWLAGTVGMPVFPRAILATLVYIAGSVILGVSMANLIEIPFLRLRDRLIPSRSSDFSTMRVQGV